MCTYWSQIIDDLPKDGNRKIVSEIGSPKHNFLNRQIKLYTYFFKTNQQ